MLGKYAVSGKLPEWLEIKIPIMQDDEAEVVIFDEENIRVEYRSLIVHKSTGTSE